MNRTTTIAKRRQPWSRSVLGLFAVVWLNLALLPCSMAFERDQDCPNCPPGHEQQMAAHQGHGDQMAEAPCTLLQPQCGELDDVSLDGRTGQLKAKTPFELPVALLDNVIDPASNLSQYDYGATDPPLLKSYSQPLHVLYCVYLD